MKLELKKHKKLYKKKIKNSLKWNKINKQKKKNLKI